MNTDYTVEDFDYDLPKHLIAQKPAERREGSRLLVYDRKTKQITDDYFYNIENYLPEETTLAVNNSKVEECRLLFDSKEIFILHSANNRTVEALVRPGRVFKVGKTVELTEGLSVHVDAETDDGHRILSFSKDLDAPEIMNHRHIPLPPYIAQNDELKDRYQTRYAKPLGSKAAPTAGLHFSDELLSRIREKHGIAEVTLHVGLGTFAPVTNDDVKAKHLHEESYEIDNQTKQLLESSQHITAVGTTTLRTLESATDTQRNIVRQADETSIFIQPGYEFKMVDSLITNFHLPKSSLMMLVAAFMGYEETMRVYEHAVASEYRFFSFGDAMLII